MATVVSELFPIPIRLASLEAEEWSRACILLIPHLSFHACFDDGEGS